MSCLGKNGTLWRAQSCRSSGPDSRQRRAANELVTPSRSSSTTRRGPRNTSVGAKRSTVRSVNAAVLIEHVGSTSVPDLPAKPIIDIQVSVIDLENEASYVPALEQLGVQLRSRDEWHRYFRPFPGRPRDVHVHVCATGSAWEREHVLFRDYLRSNEQARRAYAAAKRQAAQVWSDDGIAYTDGKSEVILTLLRDAERWPATRGT